MMVALALTLFLMTIMAEAFIIGLDAFRLSKGVADLDQALRTCSDMIRRDLRAPHFEGNLRVSEVVPNTTNPASARFAALGYFMVVEGTGRSSEGADSAGEDVHRDTDDFIMFTVRLDGTRQENFFVGLAPSELDSVGRPTNRHDNDSPTYRSQWAEIIYKLEPALDADNQPLYTDETRTVQLFNLYRRRKLLVPEFLLGSAPLGTANDLAAAPAVLASVTSSNVDTFDVSLRRSGGNYVANSPLDVQWPGNRHGVSSVTTTTGASGQTVGVLNLTSPSNAGAASGLLATNVISFDIKVFDPRLGRFVDMGDNSRGDGQFAGDAANVGNVPRSSNPSRYVYDTWCSPERQAQFGVTSPLVEPFTPTLAGPTGTPGPLRAIQVRIRAWDPTTRQAREITIVEAL